MKFRGWQATVVVGVMLSASVVLADEELRPSVAAHPDWVNTLQPKGEAGSRLVLADEGRTDYRIVVPVEPSTQEQKAAEDLQRWLHEMTDATLEIMRESGAFEPAGMEISVGRTKLLDASSIPQKAADLGEEGYAIGVEGQRLFILGGSRRGPIYGVYALLEEDLGCRWFARQTATIPKRDTLAFSPVPRTFVPKLVRRIPWHSDAHDADWSLRNRTAGHGAPVPVEWGGYPRCANWFVHSYNGLLPPAKYFAEHPEYYSEINGVRRDRQLCPTHPEVIELVTQSVLASLERCPTCQYADVSPNDWTDYCECERCKPLDEREGSKAASLLTLVNGVADAVAEVRPEVRITTLAYLDTYMPPKTIRPRDNVEIVLCTDSHAWDFPLLSIDETVNFMTALEAWTRVGANIMIWDYPIDFYRYMQPLPNMDVIKRNLEVFFEYGVDGIMEQASHSASFGVDRCEMRSWVWAKQLWEVSRDTAPLVRDFYYGYYGRAAEPLYAYDQMLHATWERAHTEWDRRHPKPITPDLEEYQEVFFPEAVEFTLEFIAESNKLFDRAMELAAGNRELIRRIEYARLPVQYLQAEREAGVAADRGAYLVLLNEFERVARREKAVYTKDAFSGPDLDRRLKLWRGMATIDLEKTHFQPLSNVWKFKPDPNDVGVVQGWFAADLEDSDWGTVRSDLSHKGWESQGYAEYEVGYGWYRQTFDVPAEAADYENLRLLFGAVDEQAEIWINGRKALSHTTDTLQLSKDFLWKQPFHFDPKPFLKPGRPNQLTVRVHNVLHVGGIWKPVYLVWGEPVSDLEGLTELLNRRSLGQR